MLSSGPNVIIWCYYVMLSSGMITPPFFIIPENFTHSFVTIIILPFSNICKILSSSLLSTTERFFFLEKYCKKTFIPYLSFNIQIFLGQNRRTDRNWVSQLVEWFVMSITDVVHSRKKSGQKPPLARWWLYCSISTNILSKEDRIAAKEREL